MSRRSLLDELEAAEEQELLQSGEDDVDDDDDDDDDDDHGMGAGYKHDYSGVIVRGGYGYQHGDDDQDEEEEDGLDELLMQEALAQYRTAEDAGADDYDDNNAASSARPYGDIGMEPLFEESAEFNNEDFSEEHNDDQVIPAASISVSPKPRRASTISLNSLGMGSVCSGPMNDQSANFSVTSESERNAKYEYETDDFDRTRQSQPTKRRQTVYRASLSQPGSSTVEADSESSGSRSSARQSLRVPRTSFFSNANRRRQTVKRENSWRTSRNSTTSSHDTDGMFSEAVDRLADNKNPWDNISAAAAVVAASAASPQKRSLIQFGQGDHVLVMVTLLNITNNTDSKDCFTVDPVNRYGYPYGEGQTEQQRHGPYKYVLCKVQTVHFDEDERYYTILRLDTHSEQRSDPAWMEPLPNADAFEAAKAAAQRTTRSLAEKDAPKAEKSGYLVWLAASPWRFCKQQLVPLYRRSRLATKKVLEDIIRGNESFALRLRFSGVNFLVLCNIIYLFIDSVTLAYLPARWDTAVKVVATVLWVVLALELIFELIIRPYRYFSIMNTEKAYAPGTARHINTFHLFFELAALICYVPSVYCATADCEDRILFNGIGAAIAAIKGSNYYEAALGRFTMGLTFLRCFGLVRHWKQMWIVHTYDGTEKSQAYFVRKMLLLDQESDERNTKRMLMRKKTDEDESETTAHDDMDRPEQKETLHDDRQLKNAANVGTALMMINSHRALLIFLFIVVFFPVISRLYDKNPVAEESMELLLRNNVLSASTDDCAYLQQSAYSWLRGMVNSTTNPRFRNKPYDFLYVVWAQILPVRCGWQLPNGVITVCPEGEDLCSIWAELQAQDEVDRGYLAGILKVRPGELVDVQHIGYANATFNGIIAETTFSVRAIFNESTSVSFAHSSMFFLHFTMLTLVLVGLTVMRGDARILVLDPLQRMLKIVVRYAENPLSEATAETSLKDRDDQGQLGKYETDQLINAISKIADLLRKCWGVAGAGIISSNLARTKEAEVVVFNPTVPGKSVYALFGFVAINDFSKLLRVLDRDVMKLINETARVVHDEVFRWALGDSGQCNKNLGAAFLMVFRIGDFKEVQEKKRKADDVVFKRQPKKTLKARRKMNAKRRGSVRNFDGGKQLQLASLPGIQSFTDRALLGMLKSFASIHRDRDLKVWQSDFRLGMGVGAFRVNLIYGMDAGWAVEGAVGSEYKIDATYLSPHVNMASRMMSACKQYGVTILLSQAVEELLSAQAKAKLRHLDTVFVKGSSVEQRIYTYDARYDGVDFFLFERSPEQADMEAAAYHPSIWENDQDLRAMRQHVNDDFMALFRKGVAKYLEGKWKEAVELLQDADDLMLRAIVEEGYVDYKADDIGGKLFDRNFNSDEVNRIRNEFGDGASKCLVQYMLRRQCIPPTDWVGVRALMSK